MTPIANVAAVYCDGGVIQVNPSPYGATWACVLVDSAGAVLHEAYGVIDDGMPSYTNNLAEFAAVVQALELLPDGWRGTVYSDSAVTLGRFFAGWKMTGIPLWLIQRGAAARKRLDWQHVAHVLLDGHPTRAQLAAGIGKRGSPVSIHNVTCDALCGRVAREWLASKTEASYA